MSSLAGHFPFLRGHSAESCLRELQLIQPSAFLALPVKHWLKSEVSIEVTRFEWMPESIRI